MERNDMKYWHLWLNVTPAFKTFKSSVADKVYGHRKITKDISTSWKMGTFMTEVSYLRFLFHCHSCFHHSQTVLNTNVLSLWWKNGGNRKRWCKTKPSKGFRQFLFSFYIVVLSLFWTRNSGFHLALYR